MTDISHLNIYISWVITAVAGAFGIGVGYTVIRVSLANLKERIIKIEVKQELQVGYDKCRDLRTDCNSRVVAKLEEIAEQVTANRQTVVNEMKETQKFIGRVEQFMLKNGGKS